MVSPFAPWPGRRAGHERCADRAATPLLLATGVLLAPLVLGPVVAPLAGVSVTAVPAPVPRSGGGVPGPAAAPTEPARSTPGLRIEGNRLLKDGEPFLPRGFNMIGLLTPAWCDRIPGVVAREHFGEAELRAARHWH